MNMVSFISSGCVDGNSEGGHNIIEKSKEVFAETLSGLTPKDRQKILRVISLLNSKTHKYLPSGGDPRYALIFLWRFIELAMREANIELYEGSDMANILSALLEFIDTNGDYYFQYVGKANQETIYFLNDLRKYNDKLYTSKTL
jgi:hypothetical protein